MMAACVRGSLAGEGLLFTLESLCLLAEADRLGSIAVGKEADLVALAQDITASDPERIQDAAVLRTMVGGNWVYTAD